jgi:ribosomal protein L16 Arg81 hydroxylase
MTPWKNTKFLHPYKDYENYEFCSLVHPTKPHKDFELDFEKTNFLEFEINKGYMLYIPPYWWYSIIYLDDPSTYVCQVTYNTLINCVSNIKNLSLYFLQQQNITKKMNHKLPESIIEEKIEKINSETLENEENINETTSTEINDLPKEDTTIDSSLNSIIIKDPLIEKEKENITYSISNI